MFSSQILISFSVLHTLQFDKKLKVSCYHYCFLFCLYFFFVYNLIILFRNYKSTKNSQQQWKLTNNYKFSIYVIQNWFHFYFISVLYVKAILWEVCNNNNNFLCLCHFRPLLLVFYLRQTRSFFFCFTDQWSPLSASLHYFRAFIF